MAFTEDQVTGDFGFGGGDSETDDKKTQSERRDPVWGSIDDPGKWLRDLNDRLYKDLSEIGKAAGIGDMEITRIFRSNIGGLNDQLVNHFMPNVANYAAAYGTTPVSFYTETDAGFDYLLNYGRRYFEGKITGLDFDVQLDQLSGSGRRGSSGARGPTPDEIRAQFDLDELAQGATKLWQGWLLEEPADPRGIARAYVDTIVSTMGEQEVDFTEFVRARAKDTARWASIYKNKPEAMAEEQYLQPYFQSASQILRPQEAADAAIRGAQFGASGQAFQQSLNRSDTVTGSAPYISALQDKMSAVSGILKG